MAALDPDVALEGEGTLAEVVRVTLIPYSLSATLVGIFGGVALFLAAIGLYGVLAYQVARRRREFGVRMALGARAGPLVRLVVGRSAWLALIGGAAGLGVSLALARVARAHLFGVTPLDPVTFVGVPVLLACVAAVAGLLPTVRALRIQPVDALRVD